MLLYQTEASHTDTAASGERTSDAQNHGAVDTERLHLQRHKQSFKSECCALLYEETTVNARSDLWTRRPQTVNTSDNLFLIIAAAIANLTFLIYSVFSLLHLLIQWGPTALFFFFFKYR